MVGREEAAPKLEVEKNGELIDVVGLFTLLGAVSVGKDVSKRMYI